MLNIINATSEEEDGVPEATFFLFRDRILRKLEPSAAANFSTTDKAVILLADFRKLKPLVKKPFGLDNDEANLQKENLSFPSGNLLEW